MCLLFISQVLKYTRSIDGDQRIANFSQDVKSDVFYLQVGLR